MTDPHYRKILESLNNPLDPAIFEACAVDLLRDVYPGLVPVHGSRDSGMDGAIADSEGGPYPLVVTTASDVLGNLTKNLDSYLKGGGLERRVVVATSRQLTATRRKHLEERAREKGFILVQIHDQRDLANRLYHNSRWAHELLGLTGEPSALSAVPSTHRPIREDIPLIGHEADLAWLEETYGDRVLVGQPGSGKTYLLLQLVRLGKALFLASDDEGRIANDLRELQPKVVIVDDAHLKPERLVWLRRIRTEVGSDTALIATAWPGWEDEVAEALALPSSQSVRTLELLTRKQILEVLRALGIDSPADDPGLGVLVDQASNKPGLAVTLGSLWLQGELRDVLTGKAIQRSLIPALKRVLESDPTHLLACFALGGNAGMSIETVAGHLQLSRDEAYRYAVLASHGGMLRLKREDVLAVEPEALRSALLGSVFFPPAGQPALPHRALFEFAPSPAAAVEALVRARLRGVPVPDEDLRQFVAEHPTTEVLAPFARLGEEESRWVLQHHPSSLRDLAPALLGTAPRATIRELLRRSKGVSGELHSKPSHPLRILQDWMQDIPFTTHRADQFSVDESIRRKSLVVDVSRDEFKTPGASPAHRVIAARASILALSPRLRSVRPSAMGSEITIRDACLGASAVPGIQKLWPLAFEILQEIVEDVWSDLSSLIHEWSRPFPGVTEETLPAMRRVARRILEDLRDTTPESPGLRSALARLAKEVELDLGLDLDGAFETLFPSQFRRFATVEVFREARAQQMECGRRLARKWAGDSPEEVLARIAHLHSEATLYSSQFSDAFLAFCRELAAHMEPPLAWLMELIQGGVEGALAGFLLSRVAQEQPAGWTDVFMVCLCSERYAPLAADALIRTTEVSSDLLDASLPHLVPQLVETACLQGEVPLPTLRALLRHPKEEVALAAAVGEWLAEPEKQVRPALRGDWSRAILRYGTESEVDRGPNDAKAYWLTAILSSEPELASTWLESRLERAREYELASEDGVYHSATQALDSGQRLQLLARMKPSHLAGQLVTWLVGDSPELYSCLLSKKNFSDSHLDPLAGRVPDPSWARLAQLALAAGYEPRKVAQASYRPRGTIWATWGPASDHWRPFQAAFESLLQTAEGRLRQVATHGLEIAREQIAAAEEEKRRFELTGRS